MTQYLKNKDNLLHMGLPWPLANELEEQLGVMTAGAASATATFSPSGNISVQLTQTANTAAATTQTLASYSLPANTLSATGQGIYVEAWGRFAANAQPKSINLVVGGVTLSSGSATQNAVSWKLTGRVMKSGTNAQEMHLLGMIGGATVPIGAVFQSTASDTSVDTGAITIAVSANSGSASASDIFFRGMVVRYEG